MELRRILWNIAANIATALKPPEASLYHYILVRADLPHGLQLAMVGHASETEPPSTTIRVLHASPEELLALESKLQAENFKFKAFREPDAPWNGQLMSIGISPQPMTKPLKKLTSKFKSAK